jgi:2-succinyl-6-hydroxy-2,4-cyclohexadiene-1-carboxylate synthase
VDNENTLRQVSLDREVNGMKIETNGVQYHVKEVGDGEPLLLLHGFTGSGENWSPYILEWSGQFKLIIVDIIGHGNSESPKDQERYQMDRVVEDLHFILQHLNINKINLLGYSMGGRLALSFAANYPNVIRSLVLESSSPGLKTEEERQIRVANDEKLARKINEGGLAAFIDFWESIPLFETQKRLTPEIQNALRTQRLKNDPLGLANSLIGMGTGSQLSWWTKLASMEFPVLLLCGEEDVKFCRIAEEMDNLLPNSVLKVIPKSGHAIHVEQRQIFGKIVKEYLNKMTN